MTTNPLSYFCLAFTLLGTKLLFWSSQPVTFGSVFLTACLSAAVSQFAAGTDIGIVSNATSVMMEGAVSTACNAVGDMSFARLACEMLGSSLEEPEQNEL